jgi:hypothetical protein
MEFASFEVGDEYAFLRAFRFIYTFDEEDFKSIEKRAAENGIKAAYKEVVTHLEVLQQSMFLVPVHMANRYVRIEQYEKAMDQVELGFEVHDQNMPYIAGGFNNLVTLYNDPRFMSIMEKLNLPMPKE